MQITLRHLVIANAAILGSLHASPSLAAGFQINEHSAIGTGRAASVVATVNDPSAVFHNPAGLTGTEGTRFQAGVTFIRPRGAYQGVGYDSTNATPGQVQTQHAAQTLTPVPNAYVSRALSPKAFVGFGFYLPYGLGLRWEDPDAFVGRTIVQEISLRTFYLTPAIALKLSDTVSVAVGVSLVPSTVYLKRTLGSPDNNQVLFPTPQYSREATMEMSGSAFGVGANAGVQITLMEHLKIGLVFRSAVDLAFSGKGHFDVPSEVPTELRHNFPDQDGDADLTIPHVFALGVGWVQGPLTIEASSQLTLWTSYDELRLNFSTGRPQPSSAIDKSWVATPVVRIGGQYELDDWAFRAGAAYDVSPVPDETIDPTLPDANRFIFSFGLGYDFGPVRADIAYMGVALPDREANSSANFAPGTYLGGIVHLLSTSVGIAL